MVGWLQDLSRWKKVEGKVYFSFKNHKKDRMRLNKCVSQKALTSLYKKRDISRSNSKDHKSFSRKYEDEQKKQKIEKVLQKIQKRSR